MVNASVNVATQKTISNFALYAPLEVVQTVKLLMFALNVLRRKISLLNQQKISHVNANPITFLKRMDNHAQHAH